MEVLLEEARENYNEEIVVELRSDEVEDIDANVARLEEWIKSWQSDRVAEQTKTS